MTPIISVIIPVYNTEKYLPACLDSLLAQTFHDFEVICIDDGSFDKCPQILQDYAKKDTRIHVLTQPNQGQSVARNKGLDHATGAYIFFLDSDDKLPDFALETLFKIAEETKVPIVASRKIKPATLPIKKLDYQVHHNVLHDFVKDKCVFSTPCNKLYRADILKTHRFIPGICFEDWPFLITLFGTIDAYATTEIPCYIYNDSNVSTVRSAFTQKKVDSYLTGIRTVYDFYKTRPDLSLAQKRIAVAIKMMVNKVYKTNDSSLTRYTLMCLEDLFEKAIIKKHHLPFKTLFRLWKMHRVK